MISGAPQPYDTQSSRMPTCRQKQHADIPSRCRSLSTSAFVHPKAQDPLAADGASFLQSLWDRSCGSAMKAGRKGLSIVPLVTSLMAHSGPGCMAESQGCSPLSSSRAAELLCSGLTTAVFPGAVEHAASRVHRGLARHHLGLMQDAGTGRSVQSVP